MLLQNVCRRREGVFKKGEFGATSPKVDNLRQKGLILKLLLRCHSRARRDNSRIIKVKLFLSAQYILQKVQKKS